MNFSEFVESRDYLLKFQKEKLISEWEWKEGGGDENERIDLELFVDKLLWRLFGVSYYDLDVLEQLEVNQLINDFLRVDSAYL